MKVDECVESISRDGFVVIKNHLPKKVWHAAKPNNSTGTRWAVISTFTRWWIKQNFRYSDEISRLGLLDSFSDSDLLILGATSQVPLNHLENIDLKGGMDRISKLRDIH